jgi:hypothetical protein
MGFNTCSRLFAFSLLVSFTLSGIIIPGALAQDRNPNDSTVVYAAEYFAQYAPITAKDMLDRIPGQGQISGGGSGRRRSPSAGGSGFASNSGDWWNGGSHTMKWLPPIQPRPIMPSGEIPNDFCARSTPNWAGKIKK